MLFFFLKEFAYALSGANIYERGNHGKSWETAEVKSTKIHDVLMKIHGSFPRFSTFLGKTKITHT